MKRFLLTLMILTMLTPGLACAEFMQQKKSAMADMPCCPKSKMTPDDATMLFKDCMKVDLQHATDAPLLKKVDVVKYTFPFITTQASSWSFTAVDNHTARGPPPDRRSVLAQSQPVYLSTLRLRI